MAKPNIFDRAVIAVAPVHAAKRAAARAALSVINSGYGNYGANLTKKSMRAGSSTAAARKRTSRTISMCCASGAAMPIWVSRLRRRH